MRSHSLIWRRVLWAVVAIVVLLAAARVALPSIVKDAVNKQLMALPQHDGHVDDIDLALWRGAYRLDGVQIVKTGSRQPTPFFEGDRVEFSIEWHSLLRGKVVAECVMWHPSVNLIRAETESQSQLGKGVNWAGQLERAMPFRFNTVKVIDGTATFRVPGIRTEDALKTTHVNGAITNMTNVAGSGKKAFAEFRATSTVLDSGSAAIAGSANPLAPVPTFDVNLTVKHVQLPKVNPWLRQYIKADAERGDFELYTELAAADGKFKGYAKPILHDVDIYSSKEPEQNPFKRLWEGLVDLAADVVEDKDTGQVAARIPLSGTIKDPKAGIMETVVSVLHNAFVHAFARSLEGSVSIRDIKKKDEKEEKKEKSE